MPQNNPLVRPYLKWAGGKRQLLAEIKKHLPKGIGSYNYYEPFVGAGAVFFELQPGKAVINDFNEQLVLTYIAIKNRVEDLISLLINHQKNNCKEYYYEIRNLDRDETQFNKLTIVEKAARLIFLNKTCFNGLYRVNSRGFFNVPYGSYKNPAVFEENVLRQISNYLNSSEITILSKDFEDVALTANKRSFVYFDPPYHSPDKLNFTGYKVNGFDENDQERLRNVMAEMTNRGVKCLLSNSDTDYVRRLYSHKMFEIIQVQAKRAINSDPFGRGAVNEVLIKNWRE